MENNVHTDSEVKPPNGNSMAKIEETSARFISAEVAQELDNIFAVIRGFTDRMLVKHGHNANLRPDLQMISDNARRAEKVIRQTVKINREPTAICT